MDKIKVAIKVRPLIEREKAEGCGVCWNVSDNCMWRKSKGEAYQFDHVFGMETSNYDIFETVATPIINAAVHGFNGTIFAYGQTSSGKTHTMMGTSTEPGIIPLAINQMFEAISSDSPNRQFLLRASYIEIYNEKINDLLSKKCNLKLREDSGQVVVAELSEEVVHTPDKLILLMKRGEKVRRIGETNMNEKSSRSHTIFRIIIESRDTEDRDGAIQVSHLNLVDLAGSERVEQAGSTGDRLKEGCAINRSLFTLGLVIAQLTEGDEYVCYRDSKLTRILQSSIGGNALTAIVCTVTPAAVEETANTLSFASRAKNIKNKPQVNEVLTEAALLKRYTRKIKELEEELERAKHVSPEMSEMESKLYEERNRNEMLEARIARLKENVINSCIDKPQTEVSSSFRRRTWCAPRMSSYRTSILKPFKSNLTSISESSDTSMPFQMWPSDASLDTSCSELTFQTPIEEFELQLLESEKTSNYFDVNCTEFETVTTRRRKKAALSILGNEPFTHSVSVQTDVSLLVDSSKTIMDTPPQVLRERVSFYQKEYDELLDYTRLEKKTCPDIHASQMCDSLNKSVHGEPESWQTSSLLSWTGSQGIEESFSSEMLLGTFQQGQQSETQLQQLISKLIENLHSKESEIISLQKANERKKSFENETEEITVELCHLASENNALKHGLSLKKKEFQEQITSLQDQYLPVAEKIRDLYLLLTKENTSHQEVIQGMEENNIENKFPPKENCTKISNLIEWLETIASKIVKMEKRTAIYECCKNEHHNTKPSSKHNIVVNDEILSDFLKRRESEENFHAQLEEAKEEILRSKEQLSNLEQEKAVLKQNSLFQKRLDCEEKNRLLHEDLEITLNKLGMLEEENGNLKTSLESKLDELTAEIASLNEKNSILKLEFSEKERNLLELAEKKESEKNYFAKLKVAENEIKLLHDEMATWKEQLNMVEEENSILKERLSSQQESLNTELTILKTEKDSLELSYSQQIESLYRKLQVDEEKLKLLGEELDEGKKQFRSLEQDKCNFEEVFKRKLELMTVENTSLQDKNTSLKLEIAEREEKLLYSLKMKESDVKVLEEELKSLHEEVVSRKEQFANLEHENAVLKEKLEFQEQSLNIELAMLRKEKDSLQLCSSQQIDSLYQKLQFGENEIRLLNEDLNIAKKQLTTLEEENLNLKSSSEIKLDILNAEIASLNEKSSILKHEFSEKEKILLELAEKKESEENYYAKLKVAENEIKLLHNKMATWKEQLILLQQEKAVQKENPEKLLESLNINSQQIESLYLELQADKDELKSLVGPQDEKIQIISLKEEKIKLNEFLERHLKTCSNEISSLKDINTSLKLKLTEKDEIISELLKVKQSEEEYSDEEELKSLHNVIVSRNEQLTVLGEEKVVLCENPRMQQKVLEVELSALRNERDSLHLSYSEQMDILNMKLQGYEEEIRLAGQELAERKMQIHALKQEACNLKKGLKTAQKSFIAEVASLQERIRILELETAQGKERIAQLLAQHSCDRVSYEEQIYHLNFKLHLFTAKLKSLCSRLGNEKQLISLEDNHNLDECLENYLEMLDIKMSAFLKSADSTKPIIQCKIQEGTCISGAGISSVEINANLFSDNINKEHMLLQMDLEKESKFTDLGEEKNELSDKVYCNEEHLCSDLGESVKVNKKQIESLNRNISQLKEANSILKREVMLEKQKIMQTLWNEVQQVQQILSLEEETEIRECSFQKLSCLRELGSVLAMNADSFCLLTENNLVSDVATSFQSSSDSFATVTESIPHSNKRNALNVYISNTQDAVVPHLPASERYETEMTGSLCGAIENIKIPDALEDSSECANAILTSEKLKYCTIVSPTQDVCTEVQAHVISRGLTPDNESALSCNTGKDKIISYSSCDCLYLKNELAAAKSHIKSLEEDFEECCKTLTDEIKCLNFEWDGSENKNLNDLLRELLNSVVKKQTEVFQSLEKEKCCCEKYSALLQDFPSYASFASEISSEISLFNRLPSACESVILRMSSDIENKSHEILASMDEIDKLQTALNLCEKDKINLSQKMEELHTHAENLRVKQASKIGELEQLHILLEEKQNRIESLNSDLQNNFQKMEFLNKQITEINENLAINSEKNDVLQSQIKVQEKENFELKVIIASHKQKLKSLTKGLNDIFVRHVARTVECNSISKENFYMAESEKEHEDIIVGEKKTSLILQEKLSCTDNIVELLDSAENEVCNILVGGTECLREADQKVQFLNEQLLGSRLELESQSGETRNRYEKHLISSCDLELELKKTFSSVYGMSHITQKNLSHEGVVLLCVNTTLEERFAASMLKIFNLQSAVRSELISKAQEESKVIQGLHEQLMQSENNNHIFRLELEQSNKNITSLCSEKKVLLGRIRQLEVDELASKKLQSNIEIAVENKKQREINCLKDENGRLTAEIKELVCKLEEMEQYNVAARQNTECCEGLSKQIKDLRIKNSELHNKLKDLDSLTSKSCTYVEKLTKCESEKLHLQECQTQNEAVISSLQMELQDALKKASDLDKENEDLLHNIEEQQTNLNIMYEQYLQNKAQNICGKESEIAELKKENEALVTQVKEIKVYIEELEQQNHILKLELGKLKDAKSVMDKQFQKLVVEHRRAFWHKHLTLTTVGTNTDSEEISGVACSCELLKETVKNLQMDLVHKKATILDLEFKMKSRTRERDLEKCLQSYQEEVHTLREQLEVAHADQATCMALAAQLQVQQVTPPKVEHKDIGMQVSFEDSSLRLSAVQEHNLMHLQHQVARLEEDKRLSHEVARLRLQEIEQVKKKNHHLLGIVSLCRCGYTVPPDSSALAHNSQEASVSGSKTRHRRPLTGVENQTHHTPVRKYL